MIAIIIGYLLHYYVNPILGIAIGILIIFFGGIIVIKSFKGKITFFILSKTIATVDINLNERKLKINQTQQPITINQQPSYFLLQNKLQ